MHRSNWVFLLVLLASGSMQLYGPAQAQVSQDASLRVAAPLTLNNVIDLAERNEPGFVLASAEERVAALQRKDARAALLPTAVYHNQVIYTQPNGQSNRIGQTTNEPSPVFIANNAVREYASQGVFNETLGLAQRGAIKIADANAARTNAELEVSRRSLVATVISLFYNVGSQEKRVLVAARALSEADRFVEITEQREAARDVAHADVIKARIQQQQRKREVAEAQLAATKARLELGILIFPDPATSYDLASSDTPPLLPDRIAAETAARANNPELRSALASLQLSEANIYAARAALLPELGLNVTYGVDAPQFAKNGPGDGSMQTRNLGYSGSASLDVPVWDWLTSVRKIKETRLVQSAAKTSVTATQRRLLADFAALYAEAATAQAEITSLDATVLAARESLRLTNLRYTDGEGTVLEVVDAQNTLISAEVAQLDGRSRYQLALAQLQTLTGSL